MRDVARFCRDLFWMNGSSLKWGWEWEEFFFIEPNIRDSSSSPSSPRSGIVFLIPISISIEPKINNFFFNILHVLTIIFSWFSTNTHHCLNLLYFILADKFSLWNIMSSRACYKYFYLYIIMVQSESSYFKPNIITKKKLWASKQ